MEKEKYICSCFKITKKDIVQAIENGASSFKEIKKITKASKKCGQCKCKVKKFTKKKLKKIK